jgi:D-alanyl-lipoteichoic acid acyltransferase DltB (MBOAT superfamily)
LIATLAFTLQLYADFSAYSDIARGLARLLGFELMVNFRLPYFAATPAEFWSRWHISLSEWLRDYIFFPLRRLLLRWNPPGGRLVALVIPPLVTMLVSGVWHGTGWNFIIWGLYYGVMMILFQALVKERPRQPTNRTDLRQLSTFRLIISWFLQRLGSGIRILFMFVLIGFGWLIFRVENQQQFLYFLTHLSLEASPDSGTMWANLVLFSLPLVVVQILQQARSDLLTLTRLPLFARVIMYGAALALIVALGVREASEFFYVQF